MAVAPRVGRIEPDQLPVEGEGTLRVALLPVGGRQVEQGLGVAGLELEHFVEIGDGVIPVLELVVDRAPTEVRVDPERREPDRLAEVGEGAIPVLEFFVGPAPAVIQVRSTRSPSDRLVVIREGVGQISLVPVGIGPVRQGPRISRAEPEELVIIGDGPIPIPERGIGKAAINVGEQAFPIQIDGPGKIRNRSGILLLLFMDGPSEEVGIGVVRVEREGPVQIGNGRVEFTQGVESARAAIEGFGVVGLPANDDVVTLDGPREVPFRERRSRLSEVVEDGSGTRRIGSGTLRLVEPVRTAGTLGWGRNDPGEAIGWSGYHQGEDGEEQGSSGQRREDRTLRAAHRRRGGRTGSLRRLGPRDGAGRTGRLVLGQLPSEESRDLVRPTPG